MSIIKLIAYTLLGYVIYELYLGVSQGVEANQADASARPVNSLAKRKSSGRGGRVVNVDGQSGALSKRSVGRGVV